MFIIWLGIVVYFIFSTISAKFLGGINMDDILSFSTNINGKERTIDLSEIMHIDHLNLDSELIEHTAKAAYYTTLSEFADHIEAQEKAVLDRYKAELSIQIRTGQYVSSIPGLTSKDIKLTEALIDSIILTDDTYTALYSKYLDAKRIKNLLGNTKTLFLQRRDMLQSFASNKRNELADSSGLRVYTQAIQRSKGGDSTKNT